MAAAVPTAAVLRLVNMTVPAGLTRLDVAVGPVAAVPGLVILQVPGGVPVAVLHLDAVAVRRMPGQAGVSVSHEGSWWP
jgi:hypothetical protein